MKILQQHWFYHNISLSMKLQQDTYLSAYALIECLRLLLNIFIFYSISSLCKMIIHDYFTFYFRNLFYIINSFLSGHYYENIIATSSFIQYVIIENIFVEYFLIKHDILNISGCTCRVCSSNCK